jgi:hypothetical protein
MKKIRENFLTKFFNKILFLLPIEIGILLFFLLVAQDGDLGWFIPEKKWTICVAIIIGSVAMTYYAFKYGYDETYRKKLQKYKAEQKKLPKEKRDGYHASQIRMGNIRNAILGFFIVLLLMFILSFFNLL